MALIAALTGICLQEFSSSWGPVLGFIVCRFRENNPIRVLDCPSFDPIAYLGHICVRMLAISHTFNCKRTKVTGPM